MSAFHASERPRLGNDLPAWEHAPHIALPSLDFTPLPDGQWRARLMVGSLNGSAWAYKNFPADKVPLLLAAWAKAPEAVLKLFQE